MDKKTTNNKPKNYYYLFAFVLGLIAIWVGVEKGYEFITYLGLIAAILHGQKYFF